MNSGTERTPGERPVTLFLCGDVMTGRGIDQILPHPGAPALHEPWLRDAREYVELAEDASGPIRRPVGFSDVWGDALAELERSAPDARIINLETSITRSSDFWPGKEIHYRMSPDNVPCLSAARIDVCTLANNHVLDFGRAGLLETLDTLHKAGIRTAGTGRALAEAQQPATVMLEGGRSVSVLAFAAESSGVDAGWAATPAQPGVAVLPDLQEATAAEISERVHRVKRPGDVVVASIHWGSNWGFPVPREHVRFAHWLVDGGVDVVHGHSSHHVRPIEVYRERLVLYGCGDFLNDYEGIRGYEAYRGDLALMYFATLTPATGQLASLRMVPLQLRGLRLHRASHQDARWLRDTLTRVSGAFGAELQLTPGGDLALRWERRGTASLPRPRKAPQPAAPAQVRGHAFADHTSEVEVRLWAPTLPELFVEAGLSLAEIMADHPVAAEGEPTDRLCLEGGDKEGLLVDWLNELLYRTELSGRLVTALRVDEIGGRVLRGKVGAGREIPAVSVKAATFHGLRILETDRGFEATVILDV